jgi:hypothetical protein
VLGSHSQCGGPAALSIRRMRQLFRPGIPWLGPPRDHPKSLYLSVCAQLLDGAESKAYYGLAMNYGALEAVVEALLERETLTGQELGQILEEAGVKKFDTPFVEGFGWGDDGRLIYPGAPVGGRPYPIHPTVRPAMCLHITHVCLTIM